MRTRTLLAAWLLLLALTAIAGAAADVAGHTTLGTVSLLALAAATITKARIILARYLGLDAQPVLLIGFSAVVGLVVAIVTASHFVRL